MAHCSVIASFWSSSFEVWTRSRVSGSEFLGCFFWDAAMKTSRGIWLALPSEFSSFELRHDEWQGHQFNVPVRIAPERLEVSCPQLVTDWGKWGCMINQLPPLKGRNIHYNQGST